MKTKTYNVFTFSELSEKAKERAKQDHAEACGFSWSADYLASIKALAEHFGGRASDWSIDWFNSTPSSMDFDMPEMEPEEIERRLAKLGTFDPETLKGHGDCVLTGFCGDESAIDGFRQWWHEGERDLSALMRAAYETWIEAAHDDCAGQFEDDAFSEMCDANGYEFDEDGRLE